MKQKIEFVKGEEKRAGEKGKIQKAKNGILLVFASCAASLFLFFALADEAPPKREEASELVSVFKETYLYDFLDLEDCENYENGEGSV